MPIKSAVEEYPNWGPPETSCPEKVRYGLELRKYLGTYLLEGWLPFDS